jgi:hypothetical protein
MNKNKLTTAGATLTPASYVSPTAMVKEIHSEGVLCISFAGKLTFSQNEEWVENDLTW